MSHAPEQSAEDAARAALERVILPDGGVLARSPRLVGLRVMDGRASAAITIAMAEAGSYEAVREAAEAALKGVSGVTKAHVALTADRAAPATRPAQRETRRPPSLEEVTHVVAIASGKGGVGKSTTAVNLALGLRALGLRVGILDADIHGPSLPTLLGLHGRPRVLADRRLAPMEAHGLAAMSIGLLVDAETAMIWRGPMVQSAITQMIAEVAWGRLDVLLVDMPPGTGDAQLAIAQGAPLSGAVIVSTPQDLALIDARRGIAMFRKVDVPILGLIENMAHFLCHVCGTRHDIFGEGGVRAEAARLGAAYLGAVPLTAELRAASDLGRPVAALAPDGPLGQIYQELASALWRNLSDRTP